MKKLIHSLFWRRSESIFTMDSEMSLAYIVCIYSLRPFGSNL